MKTTAARIAERMGVAARSVGSVLARAAAAWGARLAAAARPSSLRRALRAAVRWSAGLGLGLVAFSVAWALAYAVANPPTTGLIEAERLRLGGVERTWAPLAATPATLRLALIAAEDARFCDHNGIDFVEMRRAWRDFRAGAPLRGASTITQQTAKNVFLWPARSYARKAIEAWFAGLIELFWSKPRILEIYANVAEFGEGVFGVEAAAQRFFGRSASELTLAQSARLAAVLPAPRRRDPLSDSPAFESRVAAIVDGALTLEGSGAADCALPPPR